MEHPTIYKSSSLIEGVFGSMQLRYGNTTRCRIAESRAKDLLLRVVAFNLRSYMLAMAALKCVDFLFMRIFETTSV